MSWVKGWDDMNTQMPWAVLPIKTAAELEREQNPKLFERVKVRCTRPFCVAGKRIEIGQEVEIQRATATDLVALKKAEFVEM